MSLLALLLDYTLLSACQVEKYTVIKKIKQLYDDSRLNLVKSGMYCGESPLLQERQISSRAGT